MNPSEHQSWYVLKVSAESLTLRRIWARRPRDQKKEQKDPEYFRPAIKRLTEMGLEPFIPTKARWQKRSRYRTAKDKYRVTRPLLPGYVLIDPPEPVNWFQIAELPFVRGWIAVDGFPVRVATCGRGEEGVNEPDRLEYGEGYGLLRDKGGNLVRDKEGESVYKGLPKLPRGFRWVFERHTEIADERQILMPTNRTYKEGDEVEVIDMEAFEQKRMKVLRIRGGEAVLECDLFGGAYEIVAPLEKLAKVA